MDHLYSGEVVPQIGYQGWGEETQTEQERIYNEMIQLEQGQNEMPFAYTQRAAREWDPVLKEKWDKFQESKGYDPGSCDLTLIDEFALGRRYHWFPQDTGSCVISNTFRPWVRRCIAEILLKGQLEELPGQNEFGTANISFYAPLAYAYGRQIGGLRNGDGSFCEAQIKALFNGVIPCNNGMLLELLTQLRANNDHDFPEPRSASVYRQFQNWQYNDRFRPFLVTPLLESVAVKSVDVLVENAKQLKPAIVCSMLAIKKGGNYQGLDFYVRDTRNSWAHNMSWHGFIIYKGRIFDLLSNESWGKNIIYPIPREETESIFRMNLAVQTLGEIDMENSKPVT